MRPERWRQVEHLYNQALEMEESQRTAFLREACAGDDELRHGIERLLEEPGSFLEEPALQGMAHEFAATAATSWVGRRIGNYEFVSLAGAGGMGEVYRARDTKLKREVAIKILPEEFARDPGRVSRFQREAQLLASLNHPNIAAIYDLEENDGFRFLILELAEGETLAERLKRGPIPLDDALQIATQIAEGLGAAHERGILHRDLKPANIKLTPGGRVKVLDFGLAKAFAGEQADVNSSNSPPMMTVSELGMILGTAAYMSPEQSRGKAVDKRADIWAFGCVLYEMLTGRAPFACDTMTDTLAAIVGHAPSWAALPASTPPQVRRLLFRCLEKDPRGRLHDIADARIEIEDVLSGASPSSAETAVVQPRQRSFRLLGSIAVIASLVALIAIGALMWNFRTALRGETAPPRISRFYIATSGAAAVDPNVNIAITPDGRHFVYVGSKGLQLFVRPLDQLEAKVIFTAATPLNRVFVSPNGQWVGFVEGNTLKRVAISGEGPAMMIADADAPGGDGAAWAPDDTIIFATDDRATGLQSVPVAGGDVTVLTRPVRARGELDHLWPEMLPGGRGVLFTITATTGADAAQVAVLDLNTLATRPLLGGSNAHYVSSGHLVYTFRGELRAVQFDLARLETRGTSVTVLPGLVTSRLGRGFFDVADEGTLAYVDAPAGSASTLVLVDRDRQGQERPLALPPGYYLHPRLSLDGKKVAVAGAQLLVWDLASQMRIQLRDETTQAPVWTPDGLRLLFLGGWVAADGTGVAEPLGEGFPSDVTPDGTWALFSAGAKDIMSVALDGTRRVKPLIQTESYERNGVVSPDGSWLAYESDSSSPGKFEIYVKPFYVKPYPNVGVGKWTISTAGGTRPLWRGQELFYVAPDGAIMAVRADPRSGTWGSVGSPAKVLEGGPYLTINATSSRTYDVSTDGKRFLVIKPPRATRDTGPQIIVVQNWLFEELKHLVPATRWWR